MGKSSFTIKNEYEYILDFMTYEQAGKLLKLIFAYSARGETNIFDDQTVIMAFNFLRGSLDFDYDSDDVLINSKIRSSRMELARKKGTHTKEEWKALLSCFSMCPRCGDENVSLSKDHIIPISQGGSDDIYNLQPICKKCNSSKGPERVDYRPIDWEYHVWSSL